MLIQDALTGRLHEIPDHHYGSYLGEYGQLYEPQWGEYPQGYGYSPQRAGSQVLYDGLGNPVGLFPLLTALAPLAAKVLPVAAKVLPGLAQKVLPGLAKRFLPGLAQRFLPGLQRFLPVISQALPAINSFSQEAQPKLAQAPGPMPDQQAAPTPGPPIPASMHAPIHPPVPPVMGPMWRPMMRFHPRRRCRCVKVIRRHIAVPPPPAAMGPIREAGKAEPPGAVQGWGYYGGFNGYGRW
jgi:hypothetical protein